MTSPDAAFKAALPESSAHPWLRGPEDPQYTIDQMRAMFDAGWQAALASREAEIFKPYAKNSANAPAAIKRWRKRLPNCGNCLGILLRST